MTLQVAGNKRQPWELHSVSFGLPQGQQDTFPGPQSFPEAGAFFHSDSRGPTEGVPMTVFIYVDTSKRSETAIISRSSTARQPRKPGLTSTTRKAWLSNTR